MRHLRKSQKFTPHQSDYHQNILLRPERPMSEMVEEKLLIEQMLDALGSLSDYEHYIIRKRFFGKATLTEIAGELGVTYQAVQQSIAKTIEKLAKNLGS